MPAIRAPDDRALDHAGAAPQTASGSRLGLALVVIAPAQLMVAFDATIINMVLPHVRPAPGLCGSGLEGAVNA